MLNSEKDFNKLKSFLFLQGLDKILITLYFGEYTHWQAWIAWKPPSRPRVIKNFLSLTT